MRTQVQPDDATIAVVVVSYNTLSHLQACLDSLREARADTVIVVDNGSTDGSVEMVRACYPEVTLLLNLENQGYGAAADRAIRHSRAPYILLLNSDTYVPPQALPALSSYLTAHPEVAVVGPRLLNPDGTLQPSCYPFPTPLYLLAEESTLGRLAGHLPRLRERYLRVWDHRQTREVPWVLGAALVVRRVAYEAVGGFDSSFFMYFEEVDLCYRLHQAGWEVHFVPDVEIVHEGGASTRQYRPTMARQYFASAAHFYRRHYTWLAFALFRGLMTVVVGLRLLRAEVRAWQSREPSERRTRHAEGHIWRQVLGDVRVGWKGQEVHG